MAKKKLNVYTVSYAGITLGALAVVTAESPEAARVVAEANGATDIYEVKPLMLDFTDPSFTEIDNGEY